MPNGVRRTLLLALAVGVAASVATTALAHHGNAAAQNAIYNLRLGDSVRFLDWDCKYQNNATVTAFVCAPGRLVRNQGEPVISLRRTQASAILTRPAVLKRIGRGYFYEFSVRRR